MMGIKIMGMTLIFTVLLSDKSFCQINVLPAQNFAYRALNATPENEIVKEKMVDVSNGMKVVGTVHSEIRQTAAMVAVSLAANQAVVINYAVPDRVMLDRILLVAHIAKRIASLVNAQDNYRAKLPDGSAKQQVIQMLQDQINGLQGLWDALSTTCLPVSFKDYPVRINADIRYNDPITGTVNLLRAENGIANFTNIPYSAISGNPVKATELIYRK